MKEKFKLIIIALLFLYSQFALGQTNETTKKILSYVRLNNSYPVENIMVKTNKHIYITGEPILFNSFIVDNSNLHPSELSKVAFIELINRQNKTVIRKITKIQKGHSHGAIQIPDTLSSGGYMLRCYTSWMKNFGTSSFFTQEIVLINPLQNNEQLYSYTTDSILPNNVNVYFFPEGGNLIDSSINKIGLKIINQYHQGIKVSGITKGTSGDTLSIVSTNKDGLGSFNYFPSDSVLLSFTIDNKHYSFKLPIVNAHTASLNINKLDSTGKIEIKIKKNSKYLKSNKSDAVLLVHSKGNISFLKKLNLTKSGVSLNIHEDSLHVGVNHLVLFNSNAEIISERCYLKKPEAIYTDLLINKSEYNTREEVQVEFSDKDLKNSKFTAVVNPLELDSLVNQANFNEYFYIQTLINQNISNISNYLDNNQNNYCIEDLMLTSKYAYPTWDIVFNNKDFKPQYHPDKNGLTFRGKVTNSESSLPMQNINLILNFPGKSDKIWFTKTNDKGDFQFYLSDFENTIDFVLQPYNNTNDCSIKINYLFVGDNQTMYEKPIEYSSALKNYINISGVYKQINDIYFRPDTSKNKQPENKVAFYGTPDHLVNLKDFIDLPNMENVFLEIIPSSKIITRKGEKRFKMFSPGTGRTIKGQPTIFVDGIYISDHKKIFEMDPNNVEAISTINSAYIFGKTKMNGIINIYTKKRNGTNVSLPKSAIRRMYGNINANNDNYSINCFNEENIPYFKTQLFWNGNLDTSKNGEGVFNFLTSDAKLQYKVIIEGITEDGKFFSGNNIFRVE